MTSKFLGVIALGFLFGPVTAFASPLTVTSYAMDNGGVSGTPPPVSYQDVTYSNCPASDCTTTGAALSGGTGRLTNGVIPTTDWSVGSNSAGWIGWSNIETNGSDPTITFNFAASDTVNSVSIWYNNSLGAGQVTEPASVSIDGTSYALPADSTEGPQEFTETGLDLTGSSATVQVFQGTDQWIMIGQVAFNGTAGISVTEPATLALLVPVLAGFGLARRRKAASASGPSTMAGSRLPT